MKTLTIKLAVVGTKHYVITGGGDAEHVCPVDNAEDIGKAIQDIMEQAGKASEKAEPEPEPEPAQSQYQPPPSQDSGGEMSWWDAFTQVAQSEEGRAAFGQVAGFFESLSIKDQQKQ